MKPVHYFFSQSSCSSVLLHKKGAKSLLRFLLNLGEVNVFKDGITLFDASLFIVRKILKNMILKIGIFLVVVGVAKLCISLIMRVRQQRKGEK